MPLSLRVKFLIPLLLGGTMMALLGAWASYRATIDELREQIVKRGELLGIALNEAAKATASDDEIRFAVEQIVGEESSVYGIAVATKEPLIIWASSFRPGTHVDALTQSMLTRLRSTLGSGVFGHYFAADGDLVTLVPLSLRSAALADLEPPSIKTSAARSGNRVAPADHSWRTSYTLPANGYRGVIYLRFDWDTVKRASSTILLRSVIILLLGMVLMGALSYWLLRRTVLTPMTVISAAMQSQRQGRENARVPQLDKDEIGRLGEIFNQMLDTILERDRRFRAMVDHLPIAVSLNGIDARFEITNKKYERWFRPPREDPGTGGHYAGSVGDDRTSTRVHKEHQVIRTGEAATWEEQYWTTDGECRTCVTSMFPAFDSAGNLDAIGSASTDITDRKRDEEELRQLSKAVESAGNGILIADASRSELPIIYANPAVEQLTGYSAEEFLGRNPRFLSAKDKHQPGLDEVRSALSEGRGCRTILRNFRKDGSEFWNDFTLSPVRDAAGKLSHYIGIQSDITEQKKAEEHIHALAYFDTLTQVPNRVLFRDRLQQALTHAKRSRQSVGLLYIDLDNFKTVNDSLGHDAGDRLLQTVAKRIGQCVRQWDTVARMGGDEFTVIVDHLPASSTVQTLASIAEKVFAILSEPVLLDEQEFFVSASIGIAHYPQDGDNVDDLVKNADTAMYHSKSLGRSHCQFFLSELDIATKQQQRIEAQLRHALRRNEMALNYQPQVDLASGYPCGVEVLLRWTNPILGAVPPRLFIPAAESTGDIVQLGEWVLSTACRQFVRWQSQGMPLDRLSVNLSPRQFRQFDFVSQVNRVLRDAQLDPTCLELEVTESSIIHDPEIAVAMLQDLKGLGIRVAMDDFGTGYSSLRYLRELPIDTVKIDRSFVQDTPTDPKNVEIVTAIIAMARGLKLEIVAEGVETDEQLELLMNLGCDKAQGYWYSRPLPAADFVHWMDITTPKQFELRS